MSVTKEPGRLAANKRLRQLKIEHKLSTKDIADLLGAEYETVKNWVKLTDPPKCPPYAVELLEIKLANLRSSS